MLVAREVEDRRRRRVLFVSAGQQFQYDEISFGDFEQIRNLQIERDILFFK